MKIISDDSCTCCHSEPDTFTLLFYACEITKQFLLQFQSYIKNNCNLNFVDWTILDILFGNTEDNVLKRLKLKAKHFIYNNRLKH